VSNIPLFTALEEDEKPFIREIVNRVSQKRSYFRFLLTEWITIDKFQVTLRAAEKKTTWH